MSTAELAACTPAPINQSGFNPKSSLPHELHTKHIHKAMEEFIDFLGFINSQLNTRSIPRFESFLMPANFSSMVGEFMAAAIPKYCKGLVRNKYHNGHPDLIPAGLHVGDSIKYAPDGVEIKASRRKNGWQGHNPEDVWLMVFVFDSNSSSDAIKNVPPKSFRFVKIVGALITKADWQFSGRGATSRRTITASVKRSGYDKMQANWIYKA